MLEGIFSFGPEIIELSLWEILVSFELQNLFTTLSIVLLYSLFVLNEPITHLFVNRSNARERYEFRHFWPTLVLVPIVSIPVLWFMYHYGIFELYFGFENGIRIAVQLLLLVIAHDAYFYWCHRLLHTRALRKIHGIHHRITTPNAITSYIFHPVETVINFSFLVWFTLCAGITFGGLYFVSAFVFVLYTTFWNIYGHGAKNFVGSKRVKSWWGRGLVWPTYHALHHEKGSGNFAFVFTFWDRVMGTELDQIK